jgi:integrase
VPWKSAGNSKSWNGRSPVIIGRKSRTMTLTFSSEHGGMIDPVGFSRTFDRLVKRAGVRRITVRLARHTCGTLLAFLKVHPKVAQAILRHSQISMTMDVYTHVVGDSEREAVGMLAELLEDPLID